MSPNSRPTGGGCCFAVRTRLDLLLILKKSSKAGITDNQTGKETVDLKNVKTMLLSERSELYHRMSIGARKLDNLPVADHYIKLSFKVHYKPTMVIFCLWAPLWWQSSISGAQCLTLVIGQPKSPPVFVSADALTCKAVCH